MRQLSFFLVATALLFSSCKKDEATPITKPDANAIMRGQVATGNVLTNDVLPTSGSVVTASTSAKPSCGTVIITTAGVYTYTPTTGSTCMRDSFQYTVCNTTGQCINEWVYIRIKSKTELLTGSWKLTDAVSGGSNVFSQQPACSKDDVFTFLANGTATIDEGPTKCSTTDPQTRTTTWRWGANETELIVDNDIAKLISLTETTLVISQSSSRGITEITFTKL
jgi:hypothetical protein